MIDAGSYKDAENLAGMIARVRRELKRDDLDAETREKLEKELSICVEMWRDIDPEKRSPRA